MELTGEVWRPSAERQSRVAPHKSIRVPSCSTFDSSLICNEDESDNKYKNCGKIVEESSLVDPFAVLISTPSSWIHRRRVMSRAISHIMHCHHRTFLWDALLERRLSSVHPFRHCLATLLLSPVEGWEKQRKTNKLWERKTERKKVKQRNIQPKTT